MPILLVMYTEFLAWINNNNNNNNNISSYFTKLLAAVYMFAVCYLGPFSGILFSAFFKSLEFKILNPTYLYNIQEE